MLREGHGKEGVEAAPFLSGRQRRGVGHRAAVGQPEEIEARHRDTWTARTVVKRFHPEAAHHFRRGGRKGHPDVADRARPVNICEHYHLARLDPPARRTLASAFSATPLASSAARILESGRPAL